MVGTDEKTLAASHHPYKTLVLTQARHWFSNLACKAKRRVMTTVPSSGAKVDRILQGTPCSTHGLLLWPHYQNNSHAGRKVFATRRKEVLPRLNIPGA